MTLPTAPSKASLLAQLKARLGDFVVDGWEDRSGDELYQAIARVFSHLAQRARFELLSAYLRRARGAARHRLPVRVTWEQASEHGYTIKAGQVLFQTAWGAKFRLVEDLVRPAGVPSSYTYESPGGGGDYASASTNVAARTIFPGGGVGPFAVSMWVRQDTANGFNWMGAGYDVGDDAFLSYAAGRADQEMEFADNGALAGFVSSFPPDTAGWVHAAIVCDGSDLTAYINGVASGTGAVSGVFSAQDTLYLFASVGAGPAPAISPEPGALANVAVFDRALSADEVAALYVAGREHDITTAAGVDWAGETPPVLWDGAATGGAVANRGSGGACDLVLQGAVAAVASDTLVDPEPYQDIEVEAEWAGFEYFVAPGTITEVIVPTTADPAASILWSEDTTADGKAEFLAEASASRAGGPLITVTNTGSGALGALGLPASAATGFLDLLARERGLPRELGESDESLRARLRTMPDVVTPAAILRVMTAAYVAWFTELYPTTMPSTALALWEPWNYGYAPGQGAIGVHPPSRSHHFLVIVPALPWGGRGLAPGQGAIGVHGIGVGDTQRAGFLAGLQSHLDQIRAAGIWGQVLESD